MKKDNKFVDKIKKEEYKTIAKNEDDAKLMRRNKK